MLYLCPQYSLSGLFCQFRLFCVDDTCLVSISVYNRGMRNNNTTTKGETMTTATKLSATPLASINTIRWTATDIEVWPNGMGINYKFDRASWELLFDDALARIEVVRRDDNDSPTHIYKLHGYSSAPSTVEGLLELSCLLWLDRKEAWEVIA